MASHFFTVNGFDHNAPDALRNIVLDLTQSSFFLSLKAPIDDYQEKVSMLCRVIEQLKKDTTKNFSFFYLARIFDISIAQLFRLLEALVKFDVLNISYESLPFQEG